MRGYGVVMHHVVKDRAAGGVTSYAKPRGSVSVLHQYVLRRGVVTIEFLGYSVRQGGNSFL